MWLSRRSISGRTLFHLGPVLVRSGRRQWMSLYIFTQKEIKNKLDATSQHAKHAWLQELCHTGQILFPPQTVPEPMSDRNETTSVLVCTWELWLCSHLQPGEAGLKLPLKSTVQSSTQNRRWSDEQTTSSVLLSLSHWMYWIFPETGGQSISQHASLWRRQQWC